jgi:cellulose biosynthesis protein BcsQ
MSKKSILNKKAIETQETENNEFENKILINEPRKVLVGITNPQLASEFAFHVAKYTSVKVLIIDADGLKPSVAMCLGMRKLVNENVLTDFKSDSSFNMALDYIAKTQRPVLDIFKNIAVVHPSNKNLYVLTGNDDLERFENYSESALELLLQTAINAFDFVIVNVPFNIYDQFYLTTLTNVDHMLYGFSAYADELRIFNGQILFLNECGFGTLKKHQFIPFDYNSNRQLSVRDIKMAVDNNYIGVVNGDRKRQLYKNEFTKTYANNMSSKNIKDYHRLAKSFGYQTKKGLFVGKV